MPAAFLTPLKRIATPKGDVLHGMKASDPGYTGFGEAYFSIAATGAIKGWRRHRQMTLNLICAVGAIRFVVHDGQTDAADWLDVTLSPDSPQSYRRLTVPPMLWVAFEGVGAGENLLLNLASIPHAPDEADTADLSVFAWPSADTR